MSTERNYNVLVGPLVTEKATMLSEHGQIAFRVRLDATKAEIRRAVENLFDVKVTAVNTLRVKGKTKLFRGRRGRRSDYKKAIVTLAEGQNVDYLAGL
ncbi:MAG TPA: 50S ribosomal protein L23 [Alphaproteobacteria bacterium]|jgi:large subunit ribosomal protein L23|nr:MAG: 50S ribosomal protein L23 [Alphaproteobacteria bacterium MarineAlpha9_Bin5]PPR33348.1 MAG: 50S ribosomal protein L23 [Alphaproteobacteria bacterium MarineAlpha9_Bin6]HHZ68410.1 50S ribosomal protein L23 [Alphaproteobacteria bacterium]HIB56807.1 50S ribosomal protein L23 [Alphaproteobacteria bacterium]HIC71490.1 50S ribosomal protein L23 [Alphaproteobacteria bacterium]